MTVVEVLVASAVSAAVATGVAGLVSVGDRVTRHATDHLDEALAVSRLLERWPVEAARSVGQRRDAAGIWWLCGPPACGSGPEVAVTVPTGDSTLEHLHTMSHGSRTEVRFIWRLTDGTAVTVVGWRGVP